MLHARLEDYLLAFQVFLGKEQRHMAVSFIRVNPYRLADHFFKKKKRPSVKDIIENLGERDYLNCRLGNVLAFIP